MAIRSLIFAAALSVALLPHHGRAEERNASAPAASVSAAASNVEDPVDRQYLNLIDRTLESIRSQESAKDATCWTTVRMMDNYYALRPIDETAIFLKFEIMKGLLLKLWREASAKEKEPQISVETVKKIVPLQIQQEIPAVDPASILNLDPSIKTSIADFHRITENWRTLVSVLFEQLIASHGGKLSKAETLKIPTTDAADYLAKTLTVLNIHLLRQAKLHADGLHHESILQDDLKAGYLSLLETLKLPRDPASPANRKAETRTAAAAVAGTDPWVRSELMKITQKNIDNKVAALTKWNGVAFDPAKDYPTLLERVNKITPLPLTEDALIALLEELRTVTRLIAEGKRPMRPDTMSAGSQMHWYENKDQPAYLTVEWTWNVLEEIFPRRTEVSGDLEVKIGPNPSRVQKSDGKDEVRTVVLRFYELDAIRDSTIHWSTLKDIYAESPEELYPLEPFAAELLAERISEIAFFLIKEGERNARERGEDSIDARSMSSLFKRSTFFIPPDRPEYGWKGDFSKEKAAALKPYPAALFADVSSGSGIKSPADLAPDGPRKSPFHNGSGISLINLFGFGIGVGDYNQDKLPDLFIAGDYKNRLYKNLGNYRFEDVTAAAGIDDNEADSRHPLFADVNNDGLLDLFIVHSASPSRLFLQKNSGQFEDATENSGIKTNDFAVTTSFFDADNDGLLDLFVGNYTGLLPLLGGKNGGGNQFYHNLGNGRFKNVTQESGFGSTTLNVAATALDYDNDGRTDLFVANDFGEDELFRNIDGHKFVNVAEETGTDDRGSGMNGATVDINYDGLPDLYVTVVDMFSKSIGFKFPVASSTIKLDERILRTSFYLTGNKLLVNQKGKEFLPEEHIYFEPGDRGWGWGTNFFDYDNDGDEDMYLANGWVAGTLAADQNNQMFIRNGDRFYLSSPKSPESFAGNSRSVVTADLTNSGKVDLVVANYDSPVRIFKNSSPGQNRWLKVRLKGTKTNRFGIGSTVRLRRSGLPPLTRYITAGSGFLSQNEPEALFGLGKNDTVEAIEVVWPGKSSAQTIIKPEENVEIVVEEK